MEIKVESEIIREEAEKTILPRLKSPSHNLESRIEIYSKSSKDATSNEGFSIMVDSFSILEILSKVFAKRTIFPTNELNNIYASYVASEYALSQIRGNNLSKGGSKALNPYSFETVNFNEVWPGPREAFLTSFGKSLGKLNGLGLVAHLEMYYGWIRDTCLNSTMKYTNGSAAVIKDLKIKIKDDFEINGFARPIAAFKKPETGGLTWADIGGYEKIVDYFKGLTENLEKYDYIMSLGVLKKNEILPKGTILYGPSGTGKTTIASIFCNEANVPFIKMGASDIADRYQFGPTILLQEKFEEAARCIKEGGYKASVLFMDECDSFLGARVGDKREDSRIVTTFNEYMSGAKETDGVIVIAATNKIDLLDSAVKSKLADNTFYVGLPDKSAAKKIFNVHLKDRKCDISESDIDYLINTFDTNNNGETIWSGRDIDKIISGVYRNKVTAHIRGAADYIPTKNDFIKGIEIYNQGIGK